ncbi:hypothetical protein PYCCODRAFT_1351061, partial [Trametes coccinea BRFM310]
IRNSRLKGFKIPGCDEILKATLFADDTTAYLSQSDDFGELQMILNKWCSASKAKFNIGKTEILPIGHAEYRHEMARVYQDTGKWKGYPERAKMVGDGDAVRILGAFVGNGVNQSLIWEPRMAKLQEILDRWAVSHTTVMGKKHIAQMFVSGVTQFMTCVQRMPRTIAERLKKMIGTMIWEGKNRPPIAIEYLYKPPRLGGLGLVDIDARNDAIDIVWLRDYLSLGKSRPKWALVADDIIA